MRLRGSLVTRGDTDGVPGSAAGHSSGKYTTTLGAAGGLHRLLVDTLASNTAMVRAAERAGFVPEGRLSQAAWVNGEFADEMILGMQAADWAGAGSRQPGLDESPDRSS